MKLLTNIRSLIERIKMPASSYSSLKTRAGKYNDMMAAITYTTHIEDSEPIYDSRGVLITQVYKSKVSVIEVNITRLLAAAGVTFDKNTVNLNITGINNDDVTDVEDPDWEFK